MPDADGKFYLSDYVDELKARGFDGFSDIHLQTYVNRGYYHVARKRRWTWEQTTDTFTIAPGAAYVDLWPTVAGELPNFRSLKALYTTTPGSEAKLRPLADHEFFDQWLPLDLTSTSNRGEPGAYYIWQNRLYVLSPPSAARTFMAHYWRRLSHLVNPTDQPLTPVHLDEAVLQAALIRAHQRASEPALAVYAKEELGEIFDDMEDDEAEMMDEQPERVRPDDTWL